MLNADKNSSLAKITRQKYGIADDYTACFLQEYKDARVPFAMFKLFCDEFGEDYVKGRMLKENQEEYLFELEEDPCLRSSEQYTEIVLQDKSFENYGFNKGDIFLVDKSKKDFNGLLAVSLHGFPMIAYCDDYTEYYSAIRFSFGNRNYPPFFLPKAHMGTLFSIIGNLVLYTKEDIVF